MAGEFEAVEFHGMMNLYYPFRNSMPKLLNDVSWVRRGLDPAQRKQQNAGITTDETNS